MRMHRHALNSLDMAFLDLVSYHILLTKLSVFCKESDMSTKLTAQIMVSCAWSS